MKRIELSKNHTSEATRILKKYKTFTGFSRNKNDAYKFTNTIGIKICPYCNIEYIYTVYDVNNQSVVRPDIDHFIPKNKKTGNPSLQLALTNLIPSCLVCNERLKKDKPFSINKNIHPYYDDFDSIMCFNISLNDTDYLYEQSFDIIINPREPAKQNDINRAVNNITVFKLNERYQFHKNEVVMLFKRLKNYNKIKINDIEDLLSGQGNIYSNLLFLFPEKYCDINNTSLGKLKRDVIERYLR